MDAQSPSKRALVIAVVLVIIAAAVFYYVKKPKPISTESSITFPEVANREQGTGSQGVDVNGKSEIVQTVFQRDNLPLDVRNLIPIDAQNLTAYKISYAGMDPNNVYGAEFSFEVSAAVHNLRTFYQDQLGAAQTIGWKTVAANADDTSAFIEAERDKTGYHLEMRSNLTKNGKQIEGKIELMISKK